MTDMGETAGPQGPPPGYASDPVLGMIWGPPPPYTGNIPKSNGSGGQAAEHPTFAVELAVLYNAEQVMQANATEIADYYNPLENQVQAEMVEGTMFGQQATYLYTLEGPPIKIGNVVTNGVQSTEQDTQLQNAAREYAAQINPAMTRVLRMIADTTETVGVFIAMLDKTGQQYTAADKASVFPTPAPVKPMLQTPHDNPAASRGKSTLQ